jgi:hypothetical protein
LLSLALPPESIWAIFLALLSFSVTISLIATLQVFRHPAETSSEGSSSVFGTL